MPNNNKLVKKGRNPASVDNWLDALGLYRKNIAYDETCLFRAASEQLFDCQIHHERVRKEVVDYGRNNYYKFWYLLNDEAQWYNHMDLLSKHMVVCGNIEIQIMSKKYDRDVVVFDATRQQVYQVTNESLPKTLMLCLMNEDHYDVIHKKEHIINAGFCQSIVYGILYEKIFDIANVSDIVNGMLYDKTYVISQTEQLTEPKKSKLEINNNLDFNLISLDDKENSKKGGSSGSSGATTLTATQQVKIAPFPFKVAKALDSTIYRNIEYDSWTEVRREMRLGDWYYGDDKLILGTRCLLKRPEDNDGESLECYIQEIIKEKNKCVVYVTKLAERRTVDYTDLSPENDAKPWPLPYRFSKSIPFSASPQVIPINKAVKPIKKRRERRGNKTPSDNSVHSSSGQIEPIEHDVNVYAGAPLQMQNGTDNTSYNVPISNSGDILNAVPPPPQAGHHHAPITPDTSMPFSPKFLWDSSWNSFLPISPDPIIWSHTPTSQPQMYTNYKPMVTSSPVTPDVVPYHHDANYAYFYSIIDGDDQPKNDQPHFDPNMSQSDEAATQMMMSSSNNDRMTLCTSISQSNQQMEIYSPIIPIPPGTPVIYASTPDVADMMLPPTPMPMYAPQVDVQYMSPGPFIYPPTPPSAWYPPGINSQGFIFPTGMNQSLSK